jgi:hypothetical protein
MAWLSLVEISLLLDSNSKILVVWIDLWDFTCPKATISHNFAALTFKNTFLGDNPQAHYSFS